MACPHHDRLSVRAPPRGPRWRLPTASWPIGRPGPLDIGTLVSSDPVDGDGNDITDQHQAHDAESRQRHDPVQLEEILGGAPLSRTPGLKVPERCLAFLLGDPRGESARHATNVEVEGEGASRGKDQSRQYEDRVGQRLLIRDEHRAVPLSSVDTPTLTLSAAPRLGSEHSWSGVREAHNQHAMAGPATRRGSSTSAERKLPHHEGGRPWPVSRIVGSFISGWTCRGTRSRWRCWSRSGMCRWWTRSSLMSRPSGSWSGGSRAARSCGSVMRRGQPAMTSTAC